MASFNEVSAGSYVNVAANVGAEVRNVSRNGTSVSFEYRAYIYQSTSTWSTNTWALWIEGTQYNVKGTSQSSQNTKYYTSWRSKTITLGVGTSSTTIGVGVNGTVWSPTSAKGTVNLTLSGLPTCSKPSLNAVSISSISDKSAYVSFSVSNNNNGSITGKGIQISESNFGTVVKSSSNYSDTFTGLTPNKTYYVRGYASNAAGTSYTAVKSFTTGFTDPGAPSNLKITYDKNEPIPTANYTFSWSAGTAGSTAIAGYRFRLYKNNTEVACIDTESTATSKTINGANYNFAVGDVIKFGLYSYSKDWAGNKHFNGGGASSAHVISGTITIVSDKYIYVSVNGGTFDKKKMYISVNGGAFIEVKKEKFKTIK